MKYIIIVDMQNDFVEGSLGSPEARAIVPNIIAELEKHRGTNTALIFTQDTHFENSYLNTLEGKKLPVPHCILGTDGWAIIDELEQYRKDTDFIIPVDYTSSMSAKGVVYKSTFGSLDLINFLYTLEDEAEDQKVDEIVLMGVCTDICVISNALLLKAAFINTPISVKADCCAGVTPESHENALNAMKQCHIDII